MGDDKDPLFNIVRCKVCKTVVFSHNFTAKEDIICIDCLRGKTWSKRITDLLYEISKLFDGIQRNCEKVMIELDSTKIKNTNDIKGYSEPRAKLVDGRHLYLVCPVDGTLTQAAIAYPYNGRNYAINCPTCKHEYLIRLDNGVRKRLELRTFEDVIREVVA